MKKISLPRQKKLVSLGAKAVLVKGGHLEDTADDLLYDGKEVKCFAGKRINNKNTHGTSCTLSSSLATNLAMGMSLEEACSDI